MMLFYELAITSTSLTNNIYARPRSEALPVWLSSLDGILNIIYCFRSSVASSKITATSSREFP